MFYGNAGKQEQTIELIKIQYTIYNQNTIYNIQSKYIFRTQDPKSPTLQINLMAKNEFAFESTQKYN
jgi:hypothetical protein